MDVPAAYAAKARYSLEALLTPLGLEPVFGGEAQITYGDTAHGRESRIGGNDPTGTGSPSGKTVRLPFSPAAASFFSGSRPFAPSEASAFRFDGESWPVPFTDATGAPDLVASTFLYLSGWNEAAAAERDDHGRVPYEATLPGVLGSADRPVADAYRGALASELARAGIDGSPRRWDGREWAFCPTHDIDYISKWRPGIIYREVVEHLLLDRRRVPVRARVARARHVAVQMAGGDPYRQAFHRMVDEVARRGGTATYFIKAGAADPHDAPYALTGRTMRAWLDEVKRREFEVALHPSYRTVVEPDRLLHERDALASAASAPLVSVRQHYLRFDPARTPRLHADLGFQIDSTVGFADRTGFRRGTCLPFRAFDLANDRPLDIWEMPLIIMESALFNRQDLSLDKAVKATKDLMATCRRFGGACVVLWHNTLWDEIDCPGWGEHFTRTLDAAVKDEALLASLTAALRSWR